MSRRGMVNLSPEKIVRITSRMGSTTWLTSRRGMVDP